MILPAWLPRDLEGATYFEKDGKFFVTDNPDGLVAMFYRANGFTEVAESNHPMLRVPPPETAGAA